MTSRSPCDRATMVSRIVTDPPAIWSLRELRFNANGSSSFKVMVYPIASGRICRTARLSRLTGAHSFGCNNLLLPPLECAMVIVELEMATHHGQDELRA